MWRSRSMSEKTGQEKNAGAGCSEAASPPPHDPPQHLPAAQGQNGGQGHGQCMRARPCSRRARNCTLPAQRSCMRASNCKLPCTAPCHPAHLNSCCLKRLLARLASCLRRSLGFTKYTRSCGEARGRGGGRGWLGERRTVHNPLPGICQPRGAGCAHDHVCVMLGGTGS